MNEPTPLELNRTAITTPQGCLPFIEHLLYTVLKTCYLVSSPHQQCEVEVMAP